MEDSDVVCHKCGIRIHPPALTVTYSYSPSEKIRRRTMPLRFFNANSKIETICEELRNNPRHQKYVRKLPRAQLEKLLNILKECLNGSTVTESLQRRHQANMSLFINPNEDLNKLGDKELNAKKAIMDKLFEKNVTRPNDSGFVYDIQIDYDISDAEPCSWDCIYDAHTVSGIVETNKNDNDKGGDGGVSEPGGDGLKHQRGVTGGGDDDDIKVADINYDTDDDDDGFEIEDEEEINEDGDGGDDNSAADGVDDDDNDDEY